MLTNGTAMLAAGAAVLVALGGGRVAPAADANWVAGDNGHQRYDAVQGGTDTDKNPLFFAAPIRATIINPVG